MKLSDTSQEARMAHYKDISAVEERVNQLSEWLKEESPECFSDQKQLDEGTQERVYWQYGYMVALRDVLRFLTDSESPNQRLHKRDTSSSSPAA